MKLDITINHDSCGLLGHEAVGASWTIPDKDTLFGSIVQELPLWLGNMHVGLASVDPVVRDVWFPPNHSSKGVGLLELLNRFLIYHGTHMASAHNCLGRSTDFNIDVIVFMTVRMFLRIEVSNHSEVFSDVGATFLDLYNWALF